MAKAHLYHNVFCLKCKEVEFKMVKIGPMIFCTICFRQEFGSINELNISSADYDTKSTSYKKWLKKYNSYTE